VRTVSSEEKPILRRALILALALAAVARTAGAADPQIGRPAPVVVARTLGGGLFNLAGERGKVVVINVWATWCAPCRLEMPALDQAYRRLHARGLDMIGLSTDRASDRQKVAQVMAAFAYPAATADQTRAGGMTDTGAVPVTYVIDKAGVIRSILRGGPLSRADLEQIVGPLLRETSAPSLGDGANVAAGTFEGDRPG